MQTLIKLQALVIGALLVVMMSVDARERPLSALQMGVLFGGANGKCMGTDPACVQPAGTVCSDSDNNQTACLTNPHAYPDTTWALKCVTPNPACPTCDCTDYAKDSQGTTYFCVKFYNCFYDNMKCKKGAEVVAKRVPGTYSGTDNCVGTPGP